MILFLTLCVFWTRGVSYDFSLLGEPQEQGLVFKWGSLVGIEMLTVAANGTLFRGAADVVFRPREFTAAITNDWTTVPWCTTDFGNYGNTATDHLADINDPVRGVGDICRHMGVVEGTRWRIPTQSEWNELYREQKPEGEARRIDNNSDWSDGLFAPLHGYAFGPHQTRVAIMSDTEVTNADPYINGAVFFPTSGLRAWDNGAIWSIGLQGNSWSSTTLAIDNGYCMGFNSITVNPQYSNARAYGFSVRCIRE